MLKQMVRRINILVIISLILALFIPVISSAASSTKQLEKNFFIKADGSVWMIGDAFYDWYSEGAKARAKQLTGMKNAKNIAVKGNKVLVLSQDGTVWKNDSESEKGKFILTQIKGISNAIYIDNTYDYSVVVKKDGTVWSWGDRVIGIDGEVPQSKPVQLKQLSGVKAVGAAFNDIYVLKNDGTLFKYGLNYKTEKCETVKIKEVYNVTTISAHFNGCAVLNKNGEVWEIDDPYNGDKQTYKVQTLKNVKSINASWDDYSSSTVACTSSNKVYVWGCQGNPSHLDKIKTPTEIKGLTGAQAVSIMSGFRVFAIGRDGYACIADIPFTCEAETDDNGWQIYKSHKQGAPVITKIRAVKVG